MSTVGTPVSCGSVCLDAVCWFPQKLSFVKRCAVWVCGFKNIILMGNPSCHTDRPKHGYPWPVLTESAQNAHDIRNHFHPQPLADRPTPRTYADLALMVPRLLGAPPSPPKILRLWLRSLWRYHVLYGSCLFYSRPTATSAGGSRCPGIFGESIISKPIAYLGNNIL